MVTRVTISPVTEQKDDAARPTAAGLYDAYDSARWFYAGVARKP